MIRKVASIASPVFSLLAIFYNIFVEYVPKDITEYIDSLYPDQPYEMYVAVIGLLILWVSCYFIYKNSKYALHFVGLALLVAYIPYFFIPGIDVNMNLASNLIEFSDLSYGIAVGALLIENKVFVKAPKRKISR